MTLSGKADTAGVNERSSTPSRCAGARRVDDPDVMHLLKIMLKANGRCGVPQGGVISPLLSNLYLSLLKTPKRRRRIEIFAPPPYR
jgi:retron-type reverse transcriptase